MTDAGKLAIYVFMYAHICIRCIIVLIFDSSIQCIFPHSTTTAMYSHSIQRFYLQSVLQTTKIY